MRFIGLGKVAVMERREFLRRLGWGLACGWTVSRWGWTGMAGAASLPRRLALLGDAHLPDGKASRPEARALARAVEEIRSLKPAPELVLFAGDLAHDGNPRALELGREILADLPAPLAAVMGEGDAAGNGAAAWTRLWGEPRYSRSYPGFHLLGLHTFLSPSPLGPVFKVGREQRGWLARELSRLDSTKPLVVLSHAPLREIFRPWGQWTQDGSQVRDLLSGFPQVHCFHGHVHNEAGSGQFSTFSYDLMQPDNSSPTENRKLKTENYSLPATAWPLPSPVQGTPAAPRSGLGPQGCGWGLVTLGEKSFTFQPQVWAA